MARIAFLKSRPFAVLINIARNAPKERDRIEAIKVLAVLGYTQDILTGQRPIAGALPPGDISPDEDAVQFYLPGNARDDAAGERSA